MYLNWKVMQVCVMLMLHALLHRVWWDGCGVLPAASCSDLKVQFVFLALVAAVPGTYCLWVTWSLLQVARLQPAFAHAQSVNFIRAPRRAESL